MRIDAEPSALADLDVFLGLAERADPGGVARLRADGDVMAALVCPLRGAGGPTAIGVRALRLRQPLVLDVTLPLAALRARFAAAAGEDGPITAGSLAPAGAAAWAGIVPPRVGWTPVTHAGDLDPALLEAALLAAERLRLVDRAAGGAPAEQLTEQLTEQPGRRYGRCGPWVRLATSHGDVVVRHPTSLIVRQRPRPAPPTAQLEQ